MNIAKVKQKLEQLPLDALASQTRFIKRRAFKITPVAYVLAFLEMFVNGFNTLEVWASGIAKLTGHLVSTQGLQNRIQYPQVDFCKRVLTQLIAAQLKVAHTKQACGEFLAAFDEVILEDSTCITLPKSAHPFFPGSVNQNGDSASARIQLRMELNSGNYRQLELQGYRDNDQKYASHIINDITAGSLVIRDLGYYVLSVFKQLDEKGVFFLSRYHSRSAIYDRSGARIDLAKYLRQLRKKQISVWDEQVLLGYDTKLPVRVIAIKAPAQVEQQRKRKANRDRRAKHSAEYYELLGWTILITNVAANCWTPAQALEVYGYRWRIEIVFKCWKTNFNCKTLFKQKNALSHPRILISFYLLLVVIMLAFVHSYWIAFTRVHQQTGRILSMIKFGKFLKLTLTELFADLQDDQTIQFLARYFCQTKRKAKSHTEMIYALNSS